MRPSTSGQERGGSARPALNTVMPFVAVAAIGLGAAAASASRSQRGETVAMVALFLVALAFVALSSRRSERTWVDPIAPYLFFGVIALARQQTGGADSELAVLLALPILWLAVTGTRRDLWVATALTALVYVVPILVVGAPRYPAGEWLSAALWTGLAAFVAPVVHRLVRRLASESHRARAAASQLDAIMRGALLSSLVTTDVQGTIRSFGVGAESLFGHAADDVIGSLALNALHDPAEVAAVAEELGVRPGFPVFTELARRRAPSRIWRYVDRQGEPGYMRVAVTELRNEQDAVTGYLSVAIDATSAVQTEAARAKSESTWRVLMNHLPDTTVILVDGEQRINVVGGAGAMRQGLAGAEGRLLGEYSKPENMLRLSPLIDGALAGHDGNTELSASTTGAEHEVLVTPLPEDDSGPHALILARDVSQDRERQRAVVRAKERAERLFADAPHGVAVLDPAGTVLQVNRALDELIGPGAGGLVGRRLADLSVPGDDQLEHHLEETLATDGRTECEWTLLTAHEQEVHVVLSSRLLREEDSAEDVILVNVVDVSERRRFEQRLAHLADHDPLTGLVNRRRFDDELSRHQARCARYGPVGAVLLLDLDNFKDVNDTLGHGTGDQLIKTTAALLQGCVRGTDVVARLGGDEFAVLLPEADLAGARTVAATIVERVREHTSTLDGTRRRVTASVGGVTLVAAARLEADILALADMTMYDAKEAGRDGYVVMEEEDLRQPRTGARLEWTSRIERAIENDAFTLHLQPILDLGTGRIASAEALLRLTDCDEMVMPGRFLYIAERAGLMPDLDAWVVRKGVALLGDLRRTAPDFHLEVNLSGLSIGNSAIEQVIVDSLHEHDVDPAALILEITETAAVADVEIARQFAERMTALGCRFALDDFGAGFGSFYYLKHLLFDYVKIDGEFVANCHRSAVDRTILRSIVGIAHGLGKKAVAEFVADSRALEVVREEGVDLAQGYLIGEPVPVEEFRTRYLSAGVAPTLTPRVLRPAGDVSGRPGSGG